MRSDSRRTTASACSVLIAAAVVVACSSSHDDPSAPGPAVTPNAASPDPTTGDYPATSFDESGARNVWSGNVWADGPHAGQPVNP